MASAIALILRRPHLLFRSANTKPNSEQELSQEQGRRQKHGNSTPRLTTFDQLPTWYQDNPHVTTAYRPVSNSYHACIHSLTNLHNETLNIYTHAVPALVLALTLPGLQIQISSLYPTAPWTDRLMLTLTPMAALFTFSLSATYHTLMNHSHAVSSVCLLLDYTGILVLILASFFSGIYVGFYGHPCQQRVYWTMIISLIAISCTLVLHPRLQGPRYRSHRTTAFILTALSGLLPVLHGVLLHGWAKAFWERGVMWWVTEGLLYGLGAYFFSTRIPEKLERKRWDVFGSSHQLFHVCVVFGAMCHCWGVWRTWRVVVGV